MILGLGLGLPFGGAAPLPRTLGRAVMAAARADLVSTGHLSWLGSGLAPRGTPKPYASAAFDRSARPWDALGAIRTEGQVTVQIFAPTPDDAEDLALLLGEVLAAAWAAGRLRSTRDRNPTWWWAGDISLIQDPDPDAGGSPVWIGTRIFEFALTT